MAKILSGDAQAAIRAMQRHLIHGDGQHLALEQSDGVHQQHCALLKKRGRTIQTVQASTETAFLDALDAITLLDRVDGGFSLLLRVPGMLPKQEDYTVEDLNVDAYLPPREVQDHGKELEQAVGKLVGIFGKEIAIKHIQRLENRYANSGLQVERQSTMYSDIQTDKNIPATLLIPHPVVPGEPRYRFSGPSLRKSLRLLESDEYGDYGFMQTAEFAEDLDVIEKKAMQIDEKNKSLGSGKGKTVLLDVDAGRANLKSVEPRDAGTHKSKLTKLVEPGLGHTGTHKYKPPKLGKVIRHGVNLYPTVTESPVTAGPPERAEIAVSSTQRTIESDDNSKPARKPPTLHSDNDSSTSRLASSLHQRTIREEISRAQGPIISIGSRTDAAIDGLDLDDNFILYLQRLSQTVRSSRWAETLQEDGLDEGKAIFLANVLLADLTEGKGKGSKVML